MNYQRYKIDKTKIAVPYENGNYLLLIRAKLHEIKTKTHEATEKRLAYSYQLAISDMNLIRTNRISSSE